ncbi:MAG: 3-dehydroquinate synthase [Kiritimatiellae bacterium]|nr:3-dehydroquinate synthase [Kiritimatiellia bacterium]MDW8458549.1 3-dehydroquinate synthase [Verrucomicrobiota bacterium]
MDVMVDLGPRSYPIRIGRNALEDLPALCRERIRADRMLLVSDDTVDALYGDRVVSLLESAGFRVARVRVPPGEETKSIHWFGRLCEAAAEARLDRHSAVVALGGGVIGDLAGFVAASYARGVKLVQVPTTLLAMVDSAVGGKTGVNLPQGKNLVGAFHQPSLVVADLELLRTLPARELTAGLAEVVKYGVIRDADFFAYLEQHMESIRAGDLEILERVVARSCEIKAAVVGADERESGERAILNFGHTVGHALEQATGYSALLHGEAVAIGMDFAARLSVRLTHLPAADAGRIRALLRRAGLPTEPPDIPWVDIRRAISVDKKGAGGVPKFVLAEAIGRVRHGVAVSDELLEEIWNARGE